MPSKPSQKKTDPLLVALPEVVPTVSQPETPKKSKAPRPADDVVVEKKASKAKSVPKSEAQIPVSEPVAESVKPVCEIDNVVVSDALEHSISTGFTDFIGRFQSMITQFNSLKTELRNLEKVTSKQLKIAQKLNNKKRRKGSRAPSGFVRPSPISEELATFLGKPAGSEMARTDVTREINKYIRANALQDKENGRKIIPDKPLKALLKLEDSVELTYFNLQKYMGPHFPKVVKVVPSAPVPVPVM
jgi:upstream activation factor subunit UAF30